MEDNIVDQDQKQSNEPDHRSIENKIDQILIDIDHLDKSQLRSLIHSKQIQEF